MPGQQLCAYCGEELGQASIRRGPWVYCSEACAFEASRSLDCGGRTDTITASAIVEIMAAQMPRQEGAGSPAEQTTTQQACACCGEEVGENPVRRGSWVYCSEACAFEASRSVDCGGRTDTISAPPVVEQTPPRARTQ
jgi:hypothetical protein